MNLFAGGKKPLNTFDVIKGKKKENTLLHRKQFKALEKSAE